MRVAGVAVLALCAHSASGFADDEPQDSSLQIHGFASQGAMLSTDNNYLANTAGGTFEFAEAGINVTKQLNDRLRFGLQLFTRDLGPVGDYHATIDWFGLDYHWKDWLGIRAGRTKVAYGLYNDTSDIDAAHPVALLPQSVYPATSRDAFLAQTGVEAYGFKPLGRFGSLDYRAYGGTIFIETSSSKVNSLDVPYVGGGRVMWETPEPGLRAGISVLTARLTAEVPNPAMTVPMPATIDYDLRIRGWLASVEYVTGPFTLAGEYGRNTTRFHVSPPYPSGSKTAEQGYVLAAYRHRDWIQLASYYALVYPNREVRDGREARQHDATFAARFDVNANWLIKLEAHRMRGTALLSPALNDDIPKAWLVNNWWLFVAKTTVYF